MGAYTVIDLVGASQAFLLLLMFVLGPGYLLACSTGCLSFRKQSASIRLAIALVLGLSVCPVLTFLLGHVLPLSMVGLLFGAASMALLLVASVRCIRRRSLSYKVSRNWILFVGAVVVYLVVNLFVLVDLQLGERLYVPTVSFDYTTRTAIVAEISRTGVHPHNPFFFPGSYVPLRYHYLLYMLSSLATQFGFAGVSAHHALIATTLLTGLGLALVVPLSLRFFHPDGYKDFGQRSLLAVALLAVTGLDLIPNLVFWVGLGVPLGDLEWWNNCVMAWGHAVLWVPHHVAGLIACLIAGVIVWHESEAHHEFRSRSLVAILPASLALASAIGMSIFVAGIFACFLMICLVLALRKGCSVVVCLLFGTGIGTVLLASPYLASIITSDSVTNRLELTVRYFSFAEALVGGPDVPWWQLLIIDAISLPINYFFELGFFLIVAVLWIGHHRGRLWTRYEIVTILLFGCSIVPCTFLGSRVSNDLGWRGFLPAQYVMLLWAVDVLDGKTRLSASLKELLSLLIVIGLCGTIHEFFLVRTYPLLSDSGTVPGLGWLSTDQNLGRRTFAQRKAYDWVKTHTPATAIVQPNPNRRWNVEHGLYADRQTAAFNYDCVVGFGGQPEGCASIRATLVTLFDGKESLTGEQAGAACRDFKLDVLVVGDTDGAWKRREGWVWTETPAYANEFVKVFFCSVFPRAVPTRAYSAKGFQR